MSLDARKQDELDTQNKKKERTRLRRDLMARRETLRRETLLINKLTFEERGISKEEEEIKVETQDKEGKLVRLADQLRLLQEEISANKKNTSKYENEIKNLNQKISEIQRRAETNKKEIAKVTIDIERIAEEIRKVEGELKKI